MNYEAYRSFLLAVSNARKRVLKSGADTCITRQDADALWARCAGRCEVTGIEFSLETMPGCARRPWAPSLDRIDSKSGYDAGNLRVVCVAVNIAMNEWGEDVLVRMAIGLAATRPKHWQRAAGRLPKGVKISYVSSRGPVYQGSRTIGGKRCYTGTYPTPEEAASAILMLTNAPTVVQSNSENHVSH